MLNDLNGIKRHWNGSIVRNVPFFSYLMRIIFVITISTIAGMDFGVTIEFGDMQQKTIEREEAKIIAYILRLDFLFYQLL